VRRFLSLLSTDCLDESNARNGAFSRDTVFVSTIYACRDEHVLRWWRDLEGGVTRRCGCGCGGRAGG
jgi:hypothetical protein